MPCVKSGARAGSLYRNLVAHALTLGASGDRAPVRQQPCLLSNSLNQFFKEMYKYQFGEFVCGYWG